jgi:trans-aconitate 2-methyltransferase
LMRETLAEGGVGGAPLGTPELGARMARRPVTAAGDYRALLAPHCRSLDIWETFYMQLLSGEDPVYEWVAGAGLRPILEGLEAAERRRFIQVYRERLRVAYPTGADGRVAYPFERLFIVATV